MLYTTKQVAEKTGKHITTVRWHAKRHKIGKKIGRDWLFTEKDIDQIAEIKRGRPPLPASPVRYDYYGRSIVGANARKRGYPVGILAVVPKRDD